MTESFGSFQSRSFYGKPLNDNLFSPLAFHRSRLDQLNHKSSPKRSRSLSVDSKKPKRARTSLFSGVKHGLKKPKPKKIEPKKFINADVDKVFQPNKKRKLNDKKDQFKENEPVNCSAITPKKVLKNSSKKSSNKKSKDKSVTPKEEGFRYKYEKTPEQLKVFRVLPFSGFSDQPSVSRTGRKKLFSIDDCDDIAHLKRSSKKLKSSNQTSSSNQSSSKTLFGSHQKDNHRSPTTRDSSLQNTPSLRSAKKVICETIQLNETPSPRITKSSSGQSDVKKLTPKKSFGQSLKSPSTPSQSDTKKVTPRKTPAQSMKSPSKNILSNKSPKKSTAESLKCLSNNKKIESPRRTPHQFKKLDEPMMVDSPKSRNSTRLSSNLAENTQSSTLLDTPRTTRSSQKKYLMDQDTPKRLLSSKKNLFPKQSQTAITPVKYFEEDIMADDFNVFDILNDSLDGIQLLDEGCNDMLTNHILPTKNSLLGDKSMSTSPGWGSSPENLKVHSNSVVYTFPKYSESDVPNKSQPLNTFPRSTRHSRKCAQRLTPNRRIYGSCKKTLKSVLDLSQLQLTSPASKSCLVCAYKGDTDNSEHIQIHSNVLKLKHFGWKNECVIESYAEQDDRIIHVTANDKIWLNKVATVIDIADAELGFAESECSVQDSTKVYLYISKQTIVGLAVINPLTKANRLISSTQNYSVDYASEEQYPVCFGISRIWVLKTYRRNHIATRLLDAARKSFIPQRIVQKDELAFSVPTSDGKLLAQNYTGRKDFLIFTELKS